MAGVADFTPEVKAIIAARAGFVCDRCGADTSPWPGWQTHHRNARKMGGTRRIELGLAANGLLLDAPCHVYIEKNGDEAYACGWRVHDRFDPTTVPVLLKGQWWWYLDNEGGKTRA